MTSACSNLVLPLPTQNSPSVPIWVAKRLFSAYFGHFLAPLEPHLGHSGSGKWVKLLSLDVLSAFPTSFQPVPLNRGSHMALIMKMPILALFGLFWDLFSRLKWLKNWRRGSKRGQNRPKYDKNRLNRPLYHFGTGWNEVGTSLRTSRLSSLTHLPDPECPKCGSKGAKKWPK